MHEFRVKATLDLDNIYEQANTLQARLAQIYDASHTQIQIELAPSDTNTQNIQYRVSIPTGKIMAGASLMQLDEQSNRGYMILSGEIIAIPKPSEIIEPEVQEDQNEYDDAPIDEPMQ